MSLLELVEHYYGNLILLIITLIIATIIFTKKHPPHHLHNLPPSPLALPIIGHLHLLGPIIHHSFHKLSSLYDTPILHLRLGSIPCIVVSSPDLAKEVLLKNELSFSTRHRSTAINHLTNNGTSMAFARYGPYWKFIRKLSTTELTGLKTLNEFVPFRKQEYLRFLRVLMHKSNVGEAVNVTLELLNVTNNIICQMIMGITCSDKDGQAEEARTIVRDVTKIFGEFNVSDFIWVVRKLDLQGFRKRAEDILQRYDALIGKIIEDRVEARKKRRMREEEITYSNDQMVVGEEGDGEVKDFLDSLLDIMEGKNSEMKITIDHVKALVLDFFAAATDSTAAAVEWAIAELINNPVVLQKAQNEIEQVVGNERLVEEFDIPNLPFIQAIVNETFRLHPPLPIFNRESIIDCTVGGYDIPKGAWLFVNVWSMGRNPKYWKNPLKFKPERFLEESFIETGGSTIDVKGQHFQLLPFGSGRRGCPGIGLAMLEFSTLLADMIQCFEWKVVGPQGKKVNGDQEIIVDMTDQSGLTASRVHDFVCIPVARISPNILNL